MLEKGVSQEYQWKNVGHQYFAAFAANLVILGHGTAVGWASPAVPQLMEESTPLSTGPLTNEQLSWIGSINAIGAIFGTFTFGYITALFGCKRAMIFLGFPSMLFWCLIYFGNSYIHVLIARAASGFAGGGIQSTLVLYISEIANNDIRGRIGSLTNLSRNVGILLIFVVGAVVKYEYLPVFVVVQMVYTILFVFLPNTPQFHIRRGRFQKAENSLKFYKGFKGKSIDEVSAMNKEFDRLQSMANEQKVNKKIQFKDLCEKEAIKGLLVGTMIAVINQLTGCFTFISYAVIVFDRTGSSLDPYISSITIAVVQILGSICTAQLADTLGRKTLSMISLIGSGIGNLTLAFYMYLHLNGYDLSAYSWVPVTCISFVMFIASAGILSLTSLYTVESLPPQIREVGLVICTTALNIAAFVCMKLFPILLEIIDLHGCLLIFAGGCLIGTLFVFFVMGETKGKSMDSVS